MDCMKYKEIFESAEQNKSIYFEKLGKERKLFGRNR